VISESAGEYTGDHSAYRACHRNCCITAAHEPPVVVLLKVVVNPAHTLVVPVTGFGDGFIVTAVIDAQPVTGV